MSAYAVAHIIHLFCAIAFVGGVFFETLVLSVLHTKRVSREARREAEKALSYRAPKVMPWIVAGLFGSGLFMAHRYAEYTQATGYLASKLIHSPLSARLSRSRPGSPAPA